MIAVLASGLTVLGILGGVALLLFWLKERVSPGSNRYGRGSIEVLGRAGLGPNQGLALVRVGTRVLLVSSGEGGARTLLELSEGDLPDAEDGREDSGTRRLGGPNGRKLGILAGRIGLGIVLVALLAAAPAPSSAQVGSPTAPGSTAGSLGGLYDQLPPVSVQIGDDEEGLRLRGTVGTVLVLGLLALAPTLLLLTTGFTRILVVLHLLRQALGTQNTPPGHLLAGLALLLTAVVMAPTLEQIRVSALDPWLAGEIEEGIMMSRAVEPMRAFMLDHAREADLRTFLDISRSPAPESPDDISNAVLMSAFVTSELRAAFEIGFAIFLPFVIIDLVVAAVLTSMGMFMLPPTMIALPCKLLLFVLMDGWSLLLGALADSFV